jgi:hypothetical protein
MSVQVPHLFGGQRCNPRFLGFQKVVIKALDQRSLQIFKLRSSQIRNDVVLYVAAILEHSGWLYILQVFFFPCCKPWFNRDLIRRDVPWMFTGTSPKRWRRPAPPGWSSMWEALLENEWSDKGSGKMCLTPTTRHFTEKFRPYKSCFSGGIFECVSKIMLSANLSHVVQYARGFLKLIRVKIRVRKIKW